MLRILLKKMMKNRLITLSLLLGCLIATMLSAMVPMFTNALLDLVIAKEMQDHAENTGALTVQNPLTLAYSTRPSSMSEYERIRQADVAALENALPQSATGTYEQLLLAPALGTRFKANEKTLSMHQITNYPRYTLTSFEGLEGRTKLLFGRWPANTPGAGTIEVAISSFHFQKNDLSLDSVFNLLAYTIQGTTLALENQAVVRIVGVFDPIDAGDTFWQGEARGLFRNLGNPLLPLVMPREQLLELAGTDEHLAINQVKYNFVYDISQLRAINLAKTVSALEQTRLTYNVGTTEFVALTKTLSSLETFASGISGRVLLLQAPLLLIVLVYIYMVARMVIDADKDEIAVLKSRGAGVWQIVRLYLYQALLTGGVCVLIAPLLSSLAVLGLGSATGFLEFSARSALRPAIVPQVYLYIAAAVVVVTLTILLPAFMYAQMSIVAVKRTKARLNLKKYAKLYLAVGPALILVSLYSLLLYKGGGGGVSSLAQSGLASIDPVIFLGASALIIGATLVFLTLFPYAARLLHRLFEPFWPPSLYMALVNLSRAGNKTFFVMLFAAMTVAVGIFNANTARTYNHNIITQHYLYNTADMIVFPDFQGKSYTGGSISTSALEQLIDVYDATGDGVHTPWGLTHYAHFNAVASQVNPGRIEAFETMQSASAAELYLNARATGYAGIKSIKGLTVLGVTPAPYSHVVYAQSGLLPYHISQYLYLLTIDPSAAILSTSLRDTYGLKEGDRFTVNMPVAGIRKETTMTFVIAAFADFWPTADPTRRLPNQPFVLTNQRFIQDAAGTQPSMVLLKASDGYSMADVEAELAELEVPIIYKVNTVDNLSKAQRGPVIQTINSMLTLCFVASTGLCVVGFLLFWSFHLRTRTLQLGILRSFGLSRTRLTGSLIFEQAFSGLCAALAGALTGSLASSLFIPMIQRAFLTSASAYPYFVTMLRGDYLRIYAVVLSTLLLCIVLMVYIASRLNVARSLKLGED